MASKDTTNVTLLNVTGDNPRINQGSVDQSANAVQPSVHEGIIQKVLGPTATEVGKDLRKSISGVETGSFLRRTERSGIRTTGNRRTSASLMASY